MTHHYRKTLKLYKKRLNKDVCPFCQEAVVAEALYENDYLYIVPNLTKYDLWELHDVTDHLLVVPKKHHKSLETFTREERLALVDALARYEHEGYSVYARGKGFVRRSVEHQHTHLIKTSNKEPRFALMLTKPYVLFKK